MAKKRSGLSAPGKRAAKKGKHISDKEIDFSDIPEASDVELKAARRVGRPSTGNAKQLIAIRIDQKLLAKLKKMAADQDKPYQSLIHELLENITKKASSF